MRYRVEQNLFAVHFGYNLHIPRTYGFYTHPLMWDNIEPDDINIIKLTVTEHHKVPDNYDTEGKLDYDGYLLKSEDGQTFTNQYPRASYGQLSDDGNRRFTIHIKDTDSLDKVRNGNPKAIFELHLLSEVLEKIKRGIKELGEIPKTAERYNSCQEKRAALIKFYDRIVKEFGEKHPDYQLNFAWKPPFKESELLWPKVSFNKRVSPEKARLMSKEDIMKDLMSDGCFEIQCTNGDLLVIKNNEGSYYIDGKMQEVKTIDVFYAEKSEEDEKPVFYVHQTEYFPQSWLNAAVDCFIARFTSGDFKATGMGMSLEAITARDKESEGIQQIRS